MLLGEVVGTVVSTHKDQELEGIKFLLVQYVGSDGKKTPGVVICADAVGAGRGEWVLVAAGSSARQTKLTKDRPVDHVIMAIVDEVELGGQITYRKE